MHNAIINDTNLDYSGSGFGLSLMGALYNPDTGYWVRGDLAELSMNVLTSSGNSIDTEFRSETIDVAFHQALSFYKVLAGKPGVFLSKFGIGVTSHHNTHYWTTETDITSKTSDNQAQFGLSSIQNFQASYVQVGPALALELMPLEHLYITPSLSYNYNLMIVIEEKEAGYTEEALPEFFPEPWKHASGMVLNAGLEMRYKHLMLSTAYKSQGMRKDFALSLGYKF